MQKFYSLALIIVVYLPIKWHKSMAMQTVLYLKIDPKFGDNKGFKPPNKLGGLSAGAAKCWEHIEKSIRKFSATDITSQYLFSARYDSVVYAMQSEVMPPNRTLFSTHTFNETISTALRLVATNLERLEKNDNHIAGSSSINQTCVFETDDQNAETLAVDILKRIRHDSALKTHESITVFISDDEQITINMPPSTTHAFKARQKLTLTFSVYKTCSRSNIAWIETSTTKHTTIMFSRDERSIFCQAQDRETALTVVAKPVIYHVNGDVKIDSYGFVRFIKYELSKQHTIDIEPSHSAKN